MLEVRNPATGAVIAALAADTADTIAAKVQAARQAQPAWAALPLAERKARLAALGEGLKASLEELAATLTSEVGKPLQQSRNELNGTLARLAFFLEHVDAAVAPETVLSEAGLEERITQEPLGVIANISAWNYPIFVGSNVYFPALMTGSAVLYKPSEYATLTGLAIQKLAVAAGIPAEVFPVIVGGGDVGQLLLEQPLDGFFFTGSYGTGKHINQQVAGHLPKVQLELGGKDPAYVTDDVADPAAVAAGLADGAFYNAGQSCCAVERIYVHTRVYDAFVDAFLKEVAAFKVGDPTAEGTYIGPLTRRAQLDVLDDQVADAVARGATLRAGGKRIEGPGAFYAPTVLTEVDHSMKVMRDESFGPIIGIQRVQDDAEAARLMNDTAYGLTAAVYSATRDRAEAILRDVRTGTAYWNCCDRVSPRLPWSGRGHSGVGLTLSHYGIKAFLHPRAWHLRG